MALTQLHGSITHTYAAKLQLYTTYTATLHLYSNPADLDLVAQLPYVYLRNSLIYNLHSIFM